MNVNYTIAAFISAGMHRDVGKLDKARDILGTGCIELVTTAMEYVDYIQNLYMAGLTVVGDFPGVFDYEVSEEFGVWYIQEVLEEKALPNVDWACDKLYRLAGNFWSKGNKNLHDQIHENLVRVQQPTQPVL